MDRSLGTHAALSPARIAERLKRRKPPRYGGAVSSRRASGRIHRDNVSYLLAVLACVLLVMLAFCYWALAREAPQGWFNGLLRDIAPGLATVAIAYLVAYFALFRRGLGRDQQLVDEIVEGLTSRSAVAAEVVGFSAQPGQVPWGDLLEDSTEADVAGRWFSAWTNENYDALRKYFATGGRMRVFMLAPDNDVAIQRGAEQHAGFRGEPALEPARHKIKTGARRLRDAAAAAGRSDALDLRYVETSGVMIAQALFRFAGPRHEHLVLSAHDNFRSDRHRSPAVILDLRSSGVLREFWDNELTGFEQHSRPAESDDPMGDD